MDPVAENGNNLPSIIGFSLLAVGSSLIAQDSSTCRLAVLPYVCFPRADTGQTVSITPDRTP
jgi:hypothetical protein